MALFKLGGSKKSSKSTERTSGTVTPTILGGFGLEDLLRQATGSAQRGIEGLEGIIGGGNLVAGLTPEQLQAIEMATQAATDPGSGLNVARGVFESAAQGTAMDPVARAALERAATQGVDIDQTGRDRLLGIESGLPEASRQALEQTARGDFLYGGEGFNQALDAAMRAIRPQLISTFGRAGSGAGTGGLAQTAIGRATADTFRQQFGQERARQLQAADLLAQRTQGDRALAGDIASRIANFDLSGAGLQNDALSRNLLAGSTLADLGNLERNRQLAAAAELPGFDERAINLLDQAGAAQQAQAQAEIDAPQEALMNLIATSLGVPIDQLFGEAFQSVTRRKGKSKSGQVGIEFSA